MPADWMPADWISVAVRPNVRNADLGSRNDRSRPSPDGREFVAASEIAATSCSHIPVSVLRRDADAFAHTSER
jgi:hypothetical protein